LTLVLGASAQEAEELLHQISLILSKIEQGIFMDKTIKKVIDLSEQRAETYRYWRSRSSSERFEATYRHSVDLYRQKGIVSNGEGSTRSFARIQRKKS
jgi:hypothetical protein